MSNLGPQHINLSFGGLLQLPNGASGSLATVQDGAGNATALEVSTTAVDFPIESPTGGASGMISDLATADGSSFVGFEQAGTGAVTRSVQDKARETVSVADFGAVGNGVTDDTAKIQAAINSGAKTVKISMACAISDTINLAANQVLDFDGGSLIALAGTVAANGILSGTNKANVTVINPIIDASATSGLGGVGFLDCVNTTVINGILTKCNLAFSASSNASRIGYKAQGTIINLASWLNVGCYVSSCNGVSLDNIEVYGGQEGFGIYNNSLHVNHVGCKAHNLTQDGFVIIAGQKIDYSGCFSYNNGQSGFTTQRQTSGTNTQRVTYNGCQAYSNAYDGFDLRGANSTPWGVDMLVTASGCVSTNNAGTGFYIVFAECVTLSGCHAAYNALGNIFVHGSNRASLVGCTSESGASGVASGTSKAGIIIYDSNHAEIIGCSSTNSNGATQDYGISFIGTSGEGSVIGGYYENNNTAAYNLGGNRLIGAQANTMAGAGVFLNSISFLGTYNEEGFVVPSHTRPKGSLFTRTNGGGGELYISNGGGSWRSI